MSIQTPSPIFHFQAHQVRTAIVENQIWFSVADVCKVLGLTWSGSTLKAIPTDWQGLLKLNNPPKSQPLKVISEPAVYKLAFRSNKPEADAFTSWVASEVLPTIRKTGKYETTPQPLPLPPTTITPEQCRDLHNIVDAKLSSFPKDMQRKGYAEAWTRFNRHFRIAKYEQLPAHLFSEGQTYLINMQLHLALPLVPDNTAELEKLHDDILKKRSEMLIWAKEINARFAKLTGPLYQDVCKALPHKSRCVDTGVECLHTARYVGTDKLRDSLDYLSSAARYALYFNGRV